jgi:putative membrane protein
MTVVETTHVDPAWRRLSRRMLLVHPVQEVPRALPAIIGILVAGSANGHAWWGLATLVVVMAAGLLRWFTTTYRITPENVQVRRGLVRRRELSVPRDRVRTVDVTAHAIHRLVGLTRVTVGTGRSDRKDDGIKLDGLTPQEAARLRVELLHLRHTATEVPHETQKAPESVVAKLEPGWIRYGPFTLSGFVTVGVIAAFLSRLVNEAHVNLGRFGPLRALGLRLEHTPLGLAILEVIVACLIFVAIASTVGYILAFWKFTLTRHSAGTLHVSRGLITSRATSIEERRLRGVELSAPFSLRAVGGARLIAIATGLRVGRGAERGGTLLLPPAPQAEAVRVATDVLRTGAPITVSLEKHGPRATRRRYTRALSVVVVLILLVLALRWLIDGPAWMWQAALVLLPIGLALAVDRARQLGHRLVDGWLVTQQGSLVRRRSMLAGDGIIGWNVNRSFFQRRAGLTTLTATTAAGRQHYEVQDIELDAAIGLADAATPGLLTPFLTSSS